MKKNKNSPTDAVRRLYETPLPSARTGPLYNAFSYPTKISPEAIAVFIATHTRPGETVLDAFGGSGTTGLAAMLCDRPTETMRKMADEMGVVPEWGARNAHLFEIGKLGSFVAKTLCSPPDPELFSKAVDKLCRPKRRSARYMPPKTHQDKTGRFGTRYGRTSSSVPDAGTRHPTGMRR